MTLSQMNNLYKSQLEQLLLFSKNINRFGASLAVFDSEGSLIFVSATDDCKANWEIVFSSNIKLLKNSQAVSSKKIFLAGSILSAIIDWGDSELFVFVSLPGNPQVSLLNENESYYSDKRLEKLLFDYLSLLADSFKSHFNAENQLQAFTKELSQVYEELSLIHKLSSCMKISDSDRNFLKIACQSLSDIVTVDSISILLEDDANGKIVTSKNFGQLKLDAKQTGILKQRLIEELKEGKEALLDSNAFSKFKYEWPDNIQSIIAVPLYGKGRTGQAAVTDNVTNIIGLLFAINRHDKPDFDTVDLKLFNSVAVSCAVFVENGRLFNDLQELFIGSLKALTSSIDAKDRYTRGHSDRVAAIAKWIAQKYSEYEKLSDEQIYNIYLAGLLHDIGKIGIAEAVLCKNGKLTEDEMNCIKRHPSIGAGILSEIKQMITIIPAVLSHHERIDGKGYPNGIASDSIPLSAKIIALADGFDAMTSARVYRPAMTVEGALDEIRKNLGTQYDEKVGSIFLKSDIITLWESLQRQNYDILEKENIYDNQPADSEVVNK